MHRSNHSNDLKSSYPIFLEIGIISTLLLLITITNISIPELKKTPNLIYDSEEASKLFPQIIETQILETPPLPTASVKTPNDTPLEPSIDEFAEFEAVPKMMIPPPSENLNIDVEFDSVEVPNQLPKLIGGEEVLRKSITYPASARNSKIQGLVIVEFTVNKHGNVVNPKILSGIGGGCDEAVIKGIKTMRYKPGKKNGIPASFRLKETVQFIIIDNNY